MARRHRILNNRPQPVELHLVSGVVVIPAMGEAEVQVDDAGERHLEHLASRLHITILPAAEGGRATPIGEEAMPDETEARKARKKEAKRTR